MKKSFLLLTMLLLSSIAFSQVSFKTDGGIHGGFSFGEAKMYGIGAALEPKVFITPKISAGVRFEGTALFGGSIDASGEDVSASVSSTAAFLAKGEYYTKDEGTRPFFWIWIGLLYCRKQFCGDWRSIYFCRKTLWPGSTSRYII